MTQPPELVEKVADALLETNATMFRGRDLEAILLARAALTALARHEYRVVPDSTVLTAEEARVLVHGVVGWDQAQLDIDEATHDRAMAKLRALSSQHTESVKESG